MLVCIIVILSFDPLCKQNRRLPITNRDEYAFISIFICQLERSCLICSRYKYKHIPIVLHASHIV